MPARYLGLHSESTRWTFPPNLLRRQIMGVALAVPAFGSTPRLRCVRSSHTPRAKPVAVYP